MPFSFLEPTMRERGGEEESRARLGEEKGEWHAVLPGCREINEINIQSMRLSDLMQLIHNVTLAHIFWILKILW